MPTVEEATIAPALFVVKIVEGRLKSVTKPMSETLKRDVVALPPADVVDAMSKSAVRSPKVFWIESFAKGGKLVKVDVPIWRRFVVFSQTNCVSPVKLVAVDQNVTWFAAPAPVKLEELEMRQVEPIA